MNHAEFLGWVADHKALHPQADWEDFEAENGGRPDAYKPWATWWRRKAVAVEEARALSLLIKEAAPSQRRDADNHLNLLSRALKALREEGGLATLADDRPAGLPADPAAASDGCPDCGGASGLAMRRLVVRVGGGPEQESGTAFGCLCPLGRLHLARLRREHPRAIDLAEWHALWLREVSHRSWPPLPRPGLRRVLGGWRLKGGSEVRIVRCLDDVLLPVPPVLTDAAF